MRKSSFWLLFIATLSFGITGCSHPPRVLLDKAQSMEHVSTDSTLFYLQQIKNPQRMSGKEQADYCFLLYRATLWKTGTSKDSLLQVCTPIYLETGDTLQWLRTKTEKLLSYLYTEQPDSVLFYANLIENEKQKMNDSLKLHYYNICRTAYIRQQSYDKALPMADSCLLISKQMQDTLYIFSAIQSRLHILESLGRTDEMIEQYKGWINAFDASANYRFLNYYIANILTNFYQQRHQFSEALKYTQLLKSYRPNRNEIPYYQFTRGKIFQALNMLDSAKVYYSQASKSASPYIAVEATSRLFDLINKEAFPEQAYYMAQKGNLMYESIQINLNSNLNVKEYNEVKLQNELYQLRLSQQEKELWMITTASILLLIASLVSFFYQREKKKRLLSEQALHKEQIEEKARLLEHENLLLHKEAELRMLREKEISLRSKESEMREAMFRRISFFQKLPSFHHETTDDALPSRKIVVTNAEWAEVKLAINDGFDNFVVRLQQSFPQLTDKEINFCCLIKISINMQDLSDIYCVSKAAITKRKYRIKTDKMNITDENISLDTFLQSF